MCRDCEFSIMKNMLYGQADIFHIKEWYNGGCHWCSRYANRNWIIVYLSDFINNGDGYDLTLDFYTYFDYLRFMDFRKERNEELLRFDVEQKPLSTFFFVANCKMDDKPHKGHYYMNMDVLLMQWDESREGSEKGFEGKDSERPIFYIANFYESHRETLSDMRLLEPAGQLSYPQWMFNHLNSTLTIEGLNSNNYKLKVNNVEQGNWNEILVDDEPFLMYDIGTNAIGCQVDHDIQRQLQYHPINKDISVLFISHWHTDHYNILTGMTKTELSHIKQLVCTPYIPNLTAFSIITWFSLYPNTKLTLLRHSRGRKCKKMSTVNDQMNIYVHSFVKSNPNNSGILVYFNGPTNSVTLTGDANYSTVQEITNDSIAQFNSHGKYFMVVPHHGGDAKKFKCNIDQRVAKAEAIISVGTNNPYEHPKFNVVKDLERLFPVVSKTSDPGFIEERQL